ncbi:MAG: flagellar hook-basal body complex protein FliE [Planctomyces sp.]|nr:flagellar hook-basal body complex protein FliE [Planctomyces sp.]
MDLSALSGALPNGIASIPSIGGGASAPGAPKSGAPFSHTLANMLSDLQHQQQKLDQDVEDLATGRTDNVHQVVINVAEADLMFRMLIEVRDRLISSYQEIMRMQI